jgi:hypothetical protein
MSAAIIDLKDRRRTSRAVRTKTAAQPRQDPAALRRLLHASLRLETSALENLANIAEMLVAEQSQ